LSFVSRRALEEVVHALGLAAEVVGRLVDVQVRRPFHNGGVEPLEHEFGRPLRHKLTE
jgi:hypothetical protein